jgi:hypothetical protein
MPAIKMVVMMNTSRFIKLLLLLTSPLTGVACAWQTSTPVRNSVTGVHEGP